MTLSLSSSWIIGARKNVLGNSKINSTNFEVTPDLPNKMWMQFEISISYMVIIVNCNTNYYETNYLQIQSSMPWFFGKDSIFHMDKNNIHIAIRFLINCQTSFLSRVFIIWRQGSHAISSFTTVLISKLTINCRRHVWK